MFGRGVVLRKVGADDDRAEQSKCWACWFVAGLRCPGGFLDGEGSSVQD